MADTFVGGVGGKLADQVVVQLYTPAYLFWAGGLALYARLHWNWMKTEVGALSETRIVLLAGVVLLLVTASAAIGQRFEPGLIRLLEGYHWPPALKRMRVRRFANRLDKNDNRWQALASKVNQGSASPKEKAQYTRADLYAHQIPPDPADLMPTRLGNVLRAAERRIYAKYGLDPRICWSRLWSVMSKDDREASSAARDVLDIGARSFLWGGSFVIWTPLSWWALLVAAVAMVGSYAWMVNAAAQYGELLEAAFDIFRFAMYASLRIDPPADSSHEVELGRRVTAYLWRGTGQFVFTEPEA